MDSQGEKFWLAWDIDEFSLALSVCYRGKFVGIVELLWNDDGTLELTGIEIFEQYRPRLMHRGLGKAMLDEVVRKAREVGAKTIVGVINPIGDTVDANYLREWYARQGFIVRGREILMCL